jgi:uncharacterized protein
VLLDTTILVAALDPDARPHRLVAQALASHAGQLLTTMAVLAEALYFLGKRRGWAGQARVWRLVRAGVVTVVQDLPLERVAELMEQYRDQPMDFADASLVALAEARKLTRIFSLDSDFRIYRTADGRALEVLPA